MKTILTLSQYPLSTNRLWRTYIDKRKQIARTILSEEARKFKASANSELKAQLGKDFVPLSGPLSADIKLYPANNRKQDIDNGLKSLLDALQSAGVVENDKDFQKITVQRCEPVPPSGRADVVIEHIK